MEHVSIDGRRRTSSKASAPLAKPPRKLETPPEKLRPASPPKRNPWGSSLKTITKPAAEMFPPLPKPQAPLSPAKTPVPSASRASSISSSSELRSRDEGSVAVIATTPASPSSNTSTTSRHILEAAASRATENLWKCPFGADVVVHVGSMIFRAHRNIVEPESGWFRENLPPPNLDGSPVEVYMAFAPEAVAHCLRFIYTKKIEICEYNKEQPWNVTHLPRCVLGYCAAVFLRVTRMTNRLLQIVKNTSIELGTLFSWHYRSALGILYHERPKRLMMPMRLAMASVLDAVVYWLIRQPLFLSVIRTTWEEVLQTAVLDIAEYRRLLREANPYTNSVLPNEAAIKKLFAEADKGKEKKSRVSAENGEASSHEKSGDLQRQASLKSGRARRGSL
ncbi:hypothetical protein FALBO_16729 [Fusarium albosuccineum]|uniref:BTB domain-containing protein n=1 Tax=Fusarium albosuccineum TaxID=1237068 RepID=A0A8H4KF37_9HYPO|nr:hypothetical protein FALBO_16729 [Fusarium albosuccineum]